MYFIEIDPIINQINSILHQAAMYQDDDTTPTRKIAFKLFYLFYLGSFIVAVAAGALVANDEEFTFLMTAAIALIVAFVRLFYILHRKTEVKEFLTDIGVHSFEDREEFNETTKKLRFFKFLSHFLVLMMLGGVLFGAISCLPMFSNDIRLPLNIVFPLNWRKSKIAYCVAFVFVEIGLLITALATLIILQIWYIMINYAIMFEMLGNKLKKLGVTKEGSVTSVKSAVMTSAQSQIAKKASKDCNSRELIDLIKYHQNLKETVNRFNDCFSNFFFSQIATSAVGICCSIYYLAFGANDNLFLFTLNVSAIIYNLLDIFMVMHFGNEIKLYSDQLSFRLFQCNWVGQSKTFKKCMLIFGENLKQPQLLIIWKLYPLDLETFMRILNMAYSMFNILKTLYSH